MIGEVFVVHETGWCCSNDAVFDMYTESIRDPETEKIVAVRKTQTVKLMGVFGSLPEDVLVDIAFKVSGTNALVSFAGRVRQTGDTSIINILAKTDKVKEILSKIV